MDKLEIVLQKTPQGVVAEKIKNLGLNVTFNDGAVEIRGTLSTLSIMEKEIISSLPMDKYNMRIAETEALLSGPAGGQPGMLTEDRAKLIARKAVFETLNTEVFTAVEKAAKAIYDLMQES